MNDTVSNPLAPAPIDWTPPSPDLEISSDARSHALRPIYVSDGVNREPTNQEINDRLAEARGILGEDRFWSKATPQQSSAERQAIETREALGVRPNAQISDFTLALPAGVDPSAADMIKGALSALELAPTMGNFIGSKIAETGRRLHQMSEGDRIEFANAEQRKISAFSDGRGWDVEAKRAEVQALLQSRKVDPLIADIAMHDFEVFTRLALHTEYLRAVNKR